VPVARRRTHHADQQLLERDALLRAQGVQQLVLDCREPGMGCFEHVLSFRRELDDVPPTVGRVLPADH
jgi:hypothetical protein